MLIALRVKPAVPADRVDLLGEASDWHNPIALARESDGTFGRTLDLPRGVYQYKLLARRGDAITWSLDEGRGARSRRGARARRRAQARER